VAAKKKKARRKKPKTKNPHANRTQGMTIRPLDDQAQRQEGNFSYAWEN
jgi:hypothetical protein